MIVARNLSLRLRVSSDGRPAGTRPPFQERLTPRKPTDTAHRSSCAPVGCRTTGIVCRTTLDHRPVCVCYCERVGLGRMLYAARVTGFRHPVVKGLGSRPMEGAETQAQLYLHRYAVRVYLETRTVTGPKIDRRERSLYVCHASVYKVATRAIPRGRRGFPPLLSLASVVKQYETWALGDDGHSNVFTLQPLYSHIP